MSTQYSACSRSDHTGDSPSNAGVRRTTSMLVSLATVLTVEVTRQEEYEVRPEGDHAECQQQRDQEGPRLPHEGVHVDAGHRHDHEHQHADRRVYEPQADVQADHNSELH